MRSTLPLQAALLAAGAFLAAHALASDGVLEINQTCATTSGCFAGDGPGFSWPASFPTTRIDQIMVKGLEPVSSWSLPATGSDHLPVAASVDF